MAVGFSYDLKEGMCKYPFGDKKPDGICEVKYDSPASTLLKCVRANHMHVHLNTEFTVRWTKKPVATPKIMKESPIEVIGGYAVEASNAVSTEMSDNVSSEFVMQQVATTIYEAEVKIDKLVEKESLDPTCPATIIMAQYTVPTDHGFQCRTGKQLAIFKESEGDVKRVDIKDLCAEDISNFLSMS